jgi:hypothetical protein
MTELFQALCWYVQSYLRRLDQTIGYRLYKLTPAIRDAAFKYRANCS